MVLSEKRHVVFIQEFERICDGETTLEQAVLALEFQAEVICYSLGFEHGRVCVATVRISQVPSVIFRDNNGL